MYRKISWLDKYTSHKKEFDGILLQYQSEADRGGVDSMKKFRALDFILQAAEKMFQIEVNAVEVLSEDIYLENEMMLEEMREAKKELNGESIMVGEARDRYIKEFNRVVEPGLIRKMNKN